MRAWPTDPDQMAIDHGQSSRRRLEGEEITLTIAQVLVWTAWQGSACAAGQRLPGDDFTERTPREPHHGVSTSEYSRITSTGGGTTSRREGSAWQQIRGDQRRRVSSEETTPISSGRKQTVNPFSVAGRGRLGECFAHGGDGGGHRSWPERPGNGGGDPGRQ
jgi:hypothetical protein